MLSPKLGNIGKPQGHCFPGHAGYPVWHPTNRVDRVWHPTNSPIHPSPPYPFLPSWPSTVCIVYKSEMYALRVTTTLRVPGLIFQRAPRDRIPDRPGSGPDSRNRERWGASTFFGLLSPVRAYAHVRRWLFFALGLQRPHFCPPGPPPCACVQLVQAKQVLA